MCVVDLETRKGVPSTFADGILNALSQRLAADGLAADICVAVPNRMFENWIVSDVEALKGTGIVDDAVLQESFDGRSGVSVLKAMMRVPYRKTSHGWQLFKRTRFEVSKAHSESFKCFAEMLDI